VMKEKEGFLFFLLFSQIFCLNVLLIYTDAGTDYTDVISKLTPHFTKFDSFSAYAATPTLSFLKTYDVVFAYSNYPFSDPTTFGNNLASYVDSGYGVVMAVFSTAVGWNAAGRFQSYYAINPASIITGQSYLVPIENNHPILQGVNSFNGGSSSYRAGVWNSASEKVAQWGDGSPLIGVRVVNGTRRADLAFFPPSSDIRVDYWNSSTDGVKIMVNAINWVSGKSCGKNTNCLSCTNNNCQWCLDTNLCTMPTPSCDDRIVKPSFCPKDCGSFTKCSSCVDPSLNKVCSWCLTTNSCILHSNSDTCADVINNEKFCNSEEEK